MRRSRARAARKRGRARGTGAGGALAKTTQQFAHARHRGPGAGTPWVVGKAVATLMARRGARALRRAEQLDLSFSVDRTAAMHALRRPGTHGLRRAARDSRVRQQRQWRRASRTPATKAATRLLTQELPRAARPNMDTGW